MFSFLHVARIEISFMGKLCRVHHFASYCLSILSSFSDSSYYSPDTSLWERFQQIFCLFWTDLLWGEDCIDLFVADNVNLLLDVRKCNLSWWLLEITVVPFCLCLLSSNLQLPGILLCHPKAKKKGWSSWKERGKYKPRIQCHFDIDSHARSCKMLQSYVDLVFGVFRKIYVLHIFRLTTRIIIIRYR